MTIRHGQIGCLGMLLVVGLLGFAVEHFGQHENPGDNEGGGPLGAIGVVGFILFFVIFGVIELVRAIALRMKKTRSSPN